MYFIGQIAKLKEDFDAVQHQNTSLLQQLHDHNMVSSGDEATTAMSRKRPRVQNPHQEANSLDGPSCRQVRSGFSREKIKAVLGGFDRGWGSTKYVSVIPSYTPSGFAENLVKGVVLSPSMPGIHTMSCLM